MSQQPFPNANIAIIKNKRNLIIRSNFYFFCLFKEFSENVNLLRIEHAIKESLTVQSSDLNDNHTPEIFLHPTPETIESDILLMKLKSII